MRNFRVEPVHPDSADLRGAELVISVVSEGNSRIVHAAGECDLRSHDQLFVASTEGRHTAMVLDLTGVTFMDCGGYRSLVASRLFLEQGGRTLAIRGATGQPARLLHLIARLERPEADAIDLGLHAGPEPSTATGLQQTG